ncbi:ecdysone 20-monooxygenase isoform X2 [Copidosoma floridanum]|uniref:ecdysone 20-monooxygenase isoform X2 n=1 Tax=Copidosoma floridanum TaxID=29053 RepID=UPI0006C96564|nr:ecdysone 20-monooxygenase isoform X2 [Copidosoma floridanum]
MFTDGNWLEVVATVLLTLAVVLTNCKPLVKFWSCKKWPMGAPSTTGSINEGAKEEDARPKKVKKKLLTVRDVPGPMALPIIGTSWMFFGFCGSYSIENAHQAYRDMRSRYGQVCKQESYWNHPIVSLYERRDIEAILKRPVKYPMRPAQEVISYYRQSRQDRYATLGLVNEQGVTWQKLRATLTPELMGAKTILGFFPALNGVTDDLIDLIRSRRAVGTAAVHGFEELAYRMGLESTCMLMLGRHLGFLKPESVGSLIGKLADAVREHFLASRDAFYGFPTWKLYATSAYKNLTKSEEAIYNIISELIEATINEHHESASDEDIEAVFLSILREKSLDIREKRAAIVDFIAAGIHTVGNTLVFLLHTLGRNPRVQRHLRREADSLAPPRCDIGIDDLKDAKYIRAFIAEVFRLLPTAPCIARVLEEPIDLANYHLGQGTVVLLQTWIAGLDEANFKDADQCIPERWLEPDKYEPHAPLLVAPFGFGRRICPGKRFVEQALQLIVAKTAREFDIVADEELGLQFEYIMAPKGPVTISFHDRVDAT